MLNQSASWLKAICLFFFSIIITAQIFADSDNSNPWKSIEERAFANKGMGRTIIPNKYKTFRLDLPALQELLSTAPLRFSAEAEQQEVVVILPMPNGEMERFQIFDAPIMEYELAAEYPMIHSYAGIGLDDPTARLRFDVTQFGLHAMVLSAYHSSVYIDPYSKSDTEHYISYYKKDYQKLDNHFECHLKTKVESNVDIDKNVNTLLQGDCQLRTYRLALSSTGEYSAFHGGTVAGVLAAMNTTMTRVNGIFERDFNATMIIVANNQNLIFLNASTDPYDNNDPGALINQSQTQCDNIIGNANYDVGHVFSTGGGGLAGLGVICNNNNKGRGVTGTNNPIGDPFDVDYVAHELGHQFGANHTFNNSCSGNRNGSTAMEPGSGSTIMGYAGICGPNVQFNSDDYFHAISIQEVSNYINFSTGNNCAVLTSTGNNPPTANAGANYVLPISTPFKLTANGSDPDGDVITFNWEQMNNEIVTQPPVASNTAGPAFRSYDPSADSFRYFPKINDIVNGIDDEWEELPSVSRTMNFRVTVRDNHQGGGCTEEDNVSLTFDASAGPFEVEAPNTTLTWLAGMSETVTWDVANTDAAPVNCANVNILLSTDGGFTYPVTLASSVPNSGTYDVLVPNLSSTTCRVMVVCSDNIFFDISNQNFEIDATSAPTFTIGTDPGVQDICGSAGAASYVLDLSSIAGFNEVVALTTTGVPTGAIASFSQNNFVPTSSTTTTLTLSNLANIANGTYTITVTGTSNSITRSEEVTLIVNNSTPAAVSLNTPANAATGVSITPMLAWATASNSTSYIIEIATTPDFANDIIETSTVTNNTFIPNNLNQLTVYYWRVKAANNCGEGSATTFYSFQTAGGGCNTYTSNDTPLSISPTAAVQVNSTIAVNDNITITGVKPTMDISHTWVGDLKATITSPTGSSVVLFDQIGIPSTQFGCAENNLDLTFDDAASNTAADLEGTCNAGVAYTAQGIYQSLEALSTFAGQNANGTWNLMVEDFVNEDGGALESWGVEICFSQAPGATPSLVNNILNLNPGMTSAIPTNLLQATSSSSTASQITFILLSLPQFGTLQMNGMPATIGMTFTQTDIDNNALTYINNSSNQDDFTFDVVTNDGAWIQNETFNITINITTAVTATATGSQQVSCFNDSNGMITVNATGSSMPFQYSINGGSFQSSNIFNNLSAGTYTVEVQDAAGNTTTTNAITINNPTQLTALASVLGNTITINASGGTGTLSYNLNGMGGQSSNVFSNLAVGTYSVLIMDSNDCSITVNNISVVATPLVVSTAVTQQVSCFNGSNGMITVNATGSSMPFQYSINGGSFQSSNIFNNLSAGTYTVEVQDAAGNTTTTNAITINNPTQLTALASVLGNTITINASGGTGTLSYNLNGMGGQSSNVFSNLAVGTYSVLIMDSNDCSITVSNISVLAIPLVVSTTVTQQVSCFDGNDGIIEVNLTGGVAPFQYSLDGVNFQDNNTFTNLPSGTYFVTINDSNGSSTTSSQTIIIQPAQISATSILNGGNLTINATGGTGTLMYNLDGSAYQSSNVFSNISNGQHTIGIIDENECTTTITANVNNIVTASVSTTDVLCTDSNDGTITINSVSGGNAPYLYSLDNNNFVANNQFTGLAWGTYNVYVMDALGGVFNAGTYQVNNVLMLFIQTSVVDNTITATGSGGTGTLMYSIDGVNFQASNIFIDLPNGTYEVSVRDDNGCIEISDSILINITSIRELDFDLTFNLFPNPTQGIFNIEINQPTDQKLTLSIFDVSGKLAKEIQLNKNNRYLKEEINISNLPAGSYEVLLSDGEMFGRQRFVKM